MTVMLSIDWASAVCCTIYVQTNFRRFASESIVEGRAFGTRCGKGARMLHEFLMSRRDEIIARAQLEVAERGAPQAAEAELIHGIPLFFDQLIDTLRRSPTLNDEMTITAARHGDEMLRRGFTIAQVVHDYGDVCQAVTELAFELDVPVTVEEFHTLNRCVDDAVAQAVTEYSRLREKSLLDEGTERMGVFAHETS